MRFIEIYFNAKKAREKIKNECEIINQPITIIDMFARQSGHTKGEYRFSYASPFTQRKSPVSRISHHIELLASIANNYHRENYFKALENGSEIIKPGDKNKITRLMLHEFSLYTEDQPLSIKAFNNLIAAIEVIAQSMNENLYLIISSIAVMDDILKKVNNHLVHVQCGPIPKIDVITKANPSTLDPRYNGVRNSSYSPLNRDKETSVIPLLPLNKKNGYAVNYTGTIKCKTAGGAKFYTLIDICLDHYFAEAKKSFKLAIQLESNELLPDQVAQTVTANSIEIFPEHSVTKKIVRADSRLSYDYRNEKKTSLLLSTSRLIDGISLSFNLKEKYPQTKISCETDFVSITQPPFGSNIELRVFPTYSLEHAEEIYEKIIHRHNEDVINHHGLRHLLLSSNEKPFLYESKGEIRFMLEKNFSPFLEKSYHHRLMMGLFNRDPSYLAEKKRIKILKKYMKKIDKSLTKNEFSEDLLYELLSQLQKRAKKINDATTLIAEIESLLTTTFIKQNSIPNA